ncbi:MAG: alpha/beta hydrolase [Acidobacteriota bacterium]
MTPIRSAVLLLVCVLAGGTISRTAAIQSSPERFTVMSDGHPMAVWGRRPASPTGTVLLVHGRTWSGRPDFDLQVPGLQRSVLSSFVAKGLAAYAVDLRGYGDTPRDASGWMTPNRSATDLVNVLTWIAQQHPSLPRPTLVGWSRGGAIAMLAAQQAAPRIGALVVFGFAYDPKATFSDEAVSPKPLRERNTAAAAASDFISPAVTPPGVIHAFVAQALKSDPVLVDVRYDVEFNALAPARLSVPTLIMFGDRDPGVTRSDADKLFAAIGTPDKQVVVLPGADHAAHLENTHDAWIEAICAFIKRHPARQ